METIQVRGYERKMKAKRRDEFTKTVKEIVNLIEEAAKRIAEVNRDNILDYTDEIDDYFEVSDFARRQIIENNIKYYDAIELGMATGEEFAKVCRAQNEKELIEALEQYYNAIESWASSEEDSAKELASRTHSGTIDHSKYYLVNFDYWYGNIAQGAHSFIQIVCDSAGNILEFETEKKAREFLNKHNLDFKIMQGSEVIEHRLEDLKYMESCGGGTWRFPAEYLFIEIEEVL